MLPLSLVSRIEMVETKRIESSDGRLMVLLQGRLMPIVPISSQIDLSQPSYPVLVIATEKRSIGLLADEIVDIIEDKLEIQLASSSSDIVGSAEIRGEAVELIDVSHFIRMAEPPSKTRHEPQRVLLVTDDELLRDMLSPALAAAGYSVMPDGDSRAISNELFAPGRELRRDACRHRRRRLSPPRPACVRSSRSADTAAHAGHRPVQEPDDRVQRRTATDSGMAALVSKHDRQTLLETLAYALDASSRSAAGLNMELAA